MTLTLGTVVFVAVAGLVAIAAVSWAVVLLAASISARRARKHGQDVSMADAARAMEARRIATLAELRAPPLPSTAFTRKRELRAGPPKAPPPRPMQPPGRFPTRPAGAYDGTSDSSDARKDRQEPFSGRGGTFGGAGASGGWDAPMNAREAADAAAKGVYGRGSYAGAAFLGVGAADAESFLQASKAAEPDDLACRAPASYNVDTGSLRDTPSSVADSSSTPSGGSDSTPSQQRLLGEQ